MRPVAVVLCAALFALNAEAALLHVHQGQATDHHHQGPAAHLHRIKVPVPSTQSTITAPDEESPAVPAVLAKATAPHGHELVTAAIAVVSVRDADSWSVPLATVASRAHGPPDSGPCSLRAPPRPVLL